jgi:hypothetical protein
MSATLLENLTLVSVEADERMPARSWATGRLTEARDVFGTASRLLRPADAERPAGRGPGWFDSSWELRRGCEVCEGWPGDGNLRDWIEGWLYSAAGGGASLSAT